MDSAAVVVIIDVVDVGLDMIYYMLTTNCILP
jgi:hypothetical protein